MIPLKIRFIEIRKFKVHRNSSIGYCSNFHTIIGRNSSGKSSMFELIRFVKTGFGKKIENIEEMVFGGILGNESKEIELKLSIELSYSDRMRYVWDYLRLPTNFVESSNKTHLLREIVFEFNAYVTRVGGPRDRFDNYLILKRMEISNTQGKKVPVIREESPTGKIRVAVFTKDSDINEAPQLNADDYEKADKFLEDAITKRGQLIDRPNLGGTMTSLFQSDILTDFRNSMRFVRSDGEIQKRVAPQFLDSLDEDEEGSRIVNMMDTLFSNQPTRFKEIVKICSKIFPDIVDIRPERRPDNTVSIYVKKKNRPSEIDLAYEASGMDQLFRIIWKIATSQKNDSIWFLDEPELHLHPGAQRLLYDFLKEESERGKQIFIATQSMVFIHKSQPKEISVILDQDDSFILSLENIVKAEEKITSEKEDDIRNQIYDALGYEPKFSLEPEKIVVVEGKSDEPIIRTLSIKVGTPIDERTISFIPLGDRSHIEKYSPILAYTLSNKKCLIILDNDNKNPEDTKRDILQKEVEFKRRIGRLPILNDDNFYLYPDYVYSIEHCLLNPKAIYDAGKEALAELDMEADPGALHELSLKIEELVNSNERIKPKEVLKNIWESYGFGIYKEDKTGVRIAKCLSEAEAKESQFIRNLVSTVIR
jgi:predicted ATPase